MIPDHTDGSTIQQLCARIASLERTIESHQKLRHKDSAGSDSLSEAYSSKLALSLSDHLSPHNSVTSQSAYNSPYSSPEPHDEDTDYQTAIISDLTFETASSLAHLSLAHDGEYLGRGSLRGALHFVS